jgi:hypothetical protein
MYHGRRHRPHISQYHLDGRADRHVERSPQREIVVAHRRSGQVTDGRPSALSGQASISNIVVDVGGRPSRSLAGVWAFWGSLGLDQD